MCQSTPSTMTSPLEWTRCNASLPLHRPGYHPVRSTPGPCPHVSVWDYRSSRPSVCLQSLCIVNQSNHQQQNEDGAKREGVHAEHIARKFSHFFDRIDSRTFTISVLILYALFCMSHSSFACSRTLFRSVTSVSASNVRADINPWSFTA